MKPCSTEAHGLAVNVIESIMGQGSLKNVIAFRLTVCPASPAAPVLGAGHAGLQLFLAVN